MRFQASRAPNSHLASAVPDNALEGAWRCPQVRVTLRNGTVIVDRQTTLLVASKTHYSTNGTTGDPPQFYGNSGRYELAHDTLTLHPLVAMDPQERGGSKRYHVRAIGDTLWLTGRTEDFHHLKDGRLVPDTAVAYRVVEILLIRAGR